MLLPPSFWINLPQCIEKFVSYIYYGHCCLSLMIEKCIRKMYELGIFVHNLHHITICRHSTFSHHIAKHCHFNNLPVNHHIADVWNCTKQKI